ncbi:MAG: UvrD-helicase domain-containing protein, partial [Candidatus Cloacimonetes bacterium]|nr:UvrD-helicase domain-containing protein [Candidatus Cloacimonadota bacterium]
TNYAQFKIVNLIAKNHQNICVVGDDDQAIYSWRGADIRNILEFERDYKNVVKIKLVQNYRSPKSILNLANSLIKFNSQRHEKELWTKIISDRKPTLNILENENEEARSIAEKIHAFKLKDGNLNECVVLYRTNAQSRVFENAFIQKNIKYQIVGGVNFYQRKEIKDIIAYLRILANPQDSESLLRIINFPTRGIGKTTVAKIIDYATLKNITIYESVLSKENHLLKGAAAMRVEAFASKILNWKKASEEMPITSLIMKIIDELNLMDLYDFKDDPKDISRLENIKEFIAATNEFSENIEKETGQKPFLTEYLQNISLHTDLDSVDENEESVKLMTMHNAKGLEFDNVFIVGLENGLLPHSKSMDNEKELEEERRLLYVAITRTKKIAALSYARARRVFDAVQRTLPSRFLMEFDDELLEKENHVFYELRSPKKQIKPQKSVIMETQKYFKVGQKIIHAKFGNGIILNVDGIGKDAKLTISFSKGMLKKIMGSYVKVL